MVFTRTFRQWAGRRRQGDRIGRVGHFIKHTEAGADMPTDATIDMEVRRLRAIDALHKDRFGPRGFGYSWASFPSGRVYEGRGEHRSGAHTVGLNHSALASMHAGHGDRTPMTPAAINGDRRVIAHMQTRGAIARKYRVSGHRDHAAKSCPGNRIYPQLGELRGVTPDETTPEPEEDELAEIDENTQKWLQQFADASREAGMKPNSFRFWHRMNLSLRRQTAAHHGDIEAGDADSLGVRIADGANSGHRVKQVAQQKGFSLSEFVGKAADLVRSRE